MFLDGRRRSSRERRACGRARHRFAFSDGIAARDTPRAGALTRAKSARATGHRFLLASASDTPPSRDPIISLQGPEVVTGRRADGRNRDESFDMIRPALMISLCKTYGNSCRSPRDELSSSTDGAYRDGVCDVDRRSSSAPRSRRQAVKRAIVCASSASIARGGGTLERPAG